MILFSKDKSFKLGEKSVRTAINPSALPIGYECMGSVLLYDPDEPMHPAAEAGKKAHEAAERAVKQGIAQRQSIMPDIDPALDGGFVLDYVREIYRVYRRDKWSHFGLECYLHDTFYNYEVGGIADFFYVENGRITVVDLKTGWKPMKEHNWKQLYFYALCLGVKLGLELEDKIDLGFFTRTKYMKKTITFKDALYFKNEVCRKIKTFGFKAGEHCAECYHFHRCAEGQKKAKKVVSELVKQKPAAMEKFYQYKKLIQKYFDEVEKTLIKKHDKGENIGNFEIYETPGRKYWKAAFKKSLMKEPGMTELKLISVANAMKKGFKVEDKFELVKEKKIKYNNYIKEVKK